MGVKQPYRIMQSSRDHYEAQRRERLAYARTMTVLACIFVVMFALSTALSYRLAVDQYFHGRWDWIWPVLMVVPALISLYAAIIAIGKARDARRG